MARLHDLVRRFIPTATTEECEHYLWEATSYPCGPLLQVARQLKQVGNAIKEKMSICPQCGGTYKNNNITTFHDICAKCKVENSNAKVLETTTKAIMPMKN